MFVVRDDASHSDMVVQTSDATWQAYNTYGGNSLYTLHASLPAGQPARPTRPPTRSPTTARSTPSRDSAALVAVQRRRVPDDPLPRGQRLRRQLHQRRRRRTRAAAAAEPQAVHLQRPRRVLVGRRSARTSRRRATRASTCVLQRQRDVLEDPLGAEHRRARRRRTARSSPTRTRTSPTQQDPVDLDGHLARPALHHRRRTNIRPRTRSPASSFVVNSGTSQIKVPVRLPPAAPVAQHRRRGLTRRPERCTLAPEHARLRVGRRRRQRLPPARPVPAVVDDRSAASRCSRTTAARRCSTAPRRTT